MKINKGLFQHKYIQSVLFILIGLLAGWFIFDNSSVTHEHNHAQTQESNESEDQIWTCSMHPQIRMHEPGLCPLCAMDLIPLKTNSSSSENVPLEAIQLSEEAKALANIQTIRVSKSSAEKEIELFGTITSDERNRQSLTAHVGGRIEKLYINFTGERVEKGDKVATIYSPELFTAQQELIEAVKLVNTQPALAEAAREKLRLWKLSEQQIAAIEQSGKVSPTIDIKANTGGIIIDKKVSEGDYITAGSILFDLSDLSHVWALFEAYEGDLPFLRKGNPLTFTLQAVPGKVFSGNITFIDPLLDNTTRTSKVRVELSNRSFELKPGMYATAKVKSRLQQTKEQIIIPQSAILWTGKRSLVYRSLSGFSTPAYQLTEVELGSSLGGAYVIENGLNEGDEIVTNGAFTIDASAQLEGKRSMMNNDLDRAIPPAMEMHHTATLQHSMLKVSGNCEMCKENIEKAAKGVKGVSSAQWDQQTKELHLNFDSEQTSPAIISKAIATVGYDTELDKGNQTAYDKLPGCCKYRK